jgi:hypothetical protein
MDRNARGFAMDTQGDGYSGFAMEVGEAGEHENFGAFKEAFLRTAELDMSKLGQGTVTFKGTDGRTLVMTHNADSNLPKLVCNGAERVWNREFDLYKPVDSDGPISLGWKTGTLKINAGGATLTQTVTQDGKVTFKEQ